MRDQEGASANCIEHSKRLFQHEGSAVAHVFAELIDEANRPAGVADEEAQQAQLKRTS